jgi:hypothetical protein
LRNKERCDAEISDGLTDMDMAKGQYQVAGQRDARQPTDVDPV